MAHLGTLLVERNVDFIDNITHDLRSFGCDVTDTDSGEQALQLYWRMSPALIICGSARDKMYMWEFAHKILEDDPPPHRRPYLVAITGNKTRREMGLCYEFGFDIYSQRPVQVLDLITWIQAAREKHEQL